MAEPIMQFFTYDHLKPELKEVSKPFCELATLVESTLPRNPERSVALRKLLEAKDAAVRALLTVALLVLLLPCLSFAQTSADAGARDGGYRPPPANPFALLEVGPEVRFEQALFVTELPPQTSADPSQFDPGSVWKTLAEGIETGNWWLVAGVVVSLLTWVLRSGLLEKLPEGPRRWLHDHPAVGFLTPFVLSAIGGVVTTFASGTPFTWPTLLATIVKVGATAIATFIAAKTVAESRAAGAAAAARITTKGEAIAELRRGPNE